MTVKFFFLTRLFSCCCFILPPFQFSSLVKSWTITPRSDCSYPFLDDHFVVITGDLNLVCVGVIEER